MYDNNLFSQLVAANRSTGEVVAVDRFLVTVRGLDGAGIGAMVLFENGQRGVVREVSVQTALVLNVESEALPLGMLAVLQDGELKVPVGEGLVGRVVNPLGQPLDGKGPIQFEGQWPAFHPAPALTERAILKDALPTGVTVVDTLFPVVLGQRIAVMGDTKSGKSTFLLQTSVNQLNTGRIVVYVLIGKRRVEVDQVIKTLTDTGAISHSVVVVANIFDSLAQSYFAPYIGCAMAEYLWYHKQRDVVLVYDDLAAHAKVYREVSLLSNVNPGRDSYPGDMFFAHSSLLERAGKLAATGKTLTALPVVLTPGDDITAYLPTSIMSITDGQIIFDLATFRQNIRPAVNVGLSVSRVGGRAQDARQKALTGMVAKKLAEYRQAAEYAHFGSEMSDGSRQTLELGRYITEAFSQMPADLYSPVEQQLVLETILASAGMRQLNIGLLKRKAREMTPMVKSSVDLDVLVPQLLDAATMQGAVA